VNKAENVTSRCVALTTNSVCAHKCIVLKPLEWNRCQFAWTTICPKYGCEN